MDTFKLEVEWRDPNSLTPYANNSKKHPRDQIEQIAHQILKYGFDSPISIDEKGVIIKGHGRREAAIFIKMKKVPVIIRTDLDEHEKMAIRIADNKVAESEWDKEFLKFEIGTLARNEFNLEDTGFDLNAIDRMLNEDEPKDKKKDVDQRQQWIVSAHCKNEGEMQELYNELAGRGMEVKLIT